MITTPDEYLNSVSDQGKIWLSEFFKYMEEKYPELQLTMFRQRPMYKFKNSYLDGYIMFTVAANHFTLHCLDFKLIEEMKNLLPTASFGKGSIKVKFKDKDAIPKLKQMCDKVIEKYKILIGSASKV